MDIKAVMQHVKERGMKDTLALAKRRHTSSQSLEPVCDEHGHHIMTHRKQIRVLNTRIGQQAQQIKQLTDRVANQTQVRALNDKIQQQDKQIRRLTSELANQKQADRAFRVTLLSELANQCLASMQDWCNGSTSFDEVQNTLGRYYSFVFPDGGREPIDDSVLEFLDEFAKYENKAYNQELRKEYVKKRIPQAYNINIDKPVEQKKALFLQPRRGVNQAFKYMYNYLKQHEYDVKLFELDCGDIPMSLYYWRAEQFAKEAAVSKVVFVHESNDLLGHVNIRSDSKVVQLWHGCGVFKKIGLDTAGLPGYKTVEGYKEYPEYNYYSLVTIASPELSWVFEQFMGISKESGIIQPIGVSRTDYFFDQDYINRAYQKLYERIPQAKNKKVILYAPTYRGLGKRRVTPDALDLEKMAEQLSDDYILIMKHHQTVKTLPEIPEDIRDKFAFDMTRGKGMDIAELMTVADICVSDYSSLVFEYSLFERPMAFFVYDIEDYIDNRGLYYDFDEITPGPLCKTTQELIDYIAHIDERFDKQQVVDFKNRFMSACDGHATERIVAYIEGNE